MLYEICSLVVSPPFFKMAVTLVIVCAFLNETRSDGWTNRFIMYAV